MPGERAGGHGASSLGGDASMSGEVAVVPEGPAWDRWAGGARRRIVTAMAIEPMDHARVPDPGDGFTFDPNGPFYPPEMGRVLLDVGASRTHTTIGG